MVRMRLLVFVAVVSCVWSIGCARAQDQATTRVPSFVSDHMVLQRDVPNRIWGWDKPGTNVDVKLGPHTAAATADDDGTWSVEMPPLEAGGPHQLTVAGTDKLAIEDVLVGEVWICSGQSNMEWTVAASDNPEEEIAAANHPQIRHFKVHHQPAAEPQSDLRGDGWQPASPETAGQFTAAGYYFARELHSKLNVPIGIIGTNWGGTRIEPWTPPEGFKSVPALSDIADKLEN
jgi:sialate O-acetylesterase